MADEDFTGELLKVRDADRAERARANRDQRIAERQGARYPELKTGEQELRVTINAPNTVNVNGRSVAINIADQLATGNAATPTLQTLSLPVCIEGAAYTVVFYVASVTPA